MMKTTVRRQGKRRRTGVAVSLAVRPRGAIRIVLDDITESSEGWTVTRFYTWKDVRVRDLKAMNLAERDFASLGLAILVRLRALSNHAPDGPDRKTKDRKRLGRATARRAKARTRRFG